MEPDESPSFEGNQVWIGVQPETGIWGTPEAGLGVGAGPGLITTESKAEASKTRAEHAEMGRRCFRSVSSAGIRKLEVRKDSAELLAAGLVLVLEGVCCAANHPAPALQRESYTDLWQTRAST